MKTCNKCRAEKARTDFYRSSRAPDGISYTCKSCSIQSAHEWNVKNKERANASRRRSEKKKWRDPKAVAEHLEYHANYRAAHRGEMAAYLKGYRKANPDRIRLWRKNRRAALANSLKPRWADAALMRDMYAEAAYFGLQVDHIVPLVSPLVCGLHCEANLQLLTAAENKAKGNRRWPDMPLGEN